MRRALLWLPAAVATAAFCSGCQTTAQRSAELQKHAKHQVLASKGVTVAKENPDVQVLQSSIVRSSEGAAVVVSLRNVSSHALKDAPIQITVLDAHGKAVFQNDQPGLDPSLTTVSLLPPGEETMWVDDQIPISGAPAKATALVGEATRAAADLPSLSISPTRLGGEGGEATASGAVTNRSKVAQEHLVVYSIARRGSKVVAAGRAVLPEALPGKTVPFLLYFVGDPQGAKLQTSAPATTF